MTKKAGAVEGEEQVEGQEGAEGENQEQKKTAAEIAAEERAAAAEARAQAAEEAAEAAKKSEANGKQPRTFTLSSWSEDEWAAAEAQTGLDRKTLLANINLKEQTKGAIDGATRRLEAKLEFQQARESMASEDPLYPKYRKEVDAFLADIPDEVKLADPKKWVRKAFDVAKKTVKTPTSTTRRADNMDTRESAASTKEKGAGADEYSAEEKAAIEGNGKTVEDYNKIKHPYLKDGIMIKDRPQEPKFGPK